MYVADLDAGQRGRTERHDVADAQPPARLVLRAIEVHGRAGPSVGLPAAPAAEMPMCEAFSSPSMSEMTRRISSGVRDPATRGS